MRKRVLSLFTTLVMVLGLMPFVTVPVMANTPKTITVGGIGSDYETVSAALVSADDPVVDEGDTIKLLYNVTETGSITPTFDFRLDLNGSTLTGSGSAPVFDFSQGGSVTVTTTSNNLVGGEIDIKGMSLYNDSFSDSASKIIFNNTKNPITLKDSTRTNNTFAVGTGRIDEFTIMNNEGDTHAAQVLISAGAVMTIDQAMIIPGKPSGLNIANNITVLGTLEVVAGGSLTVETGSLLIVKTTTGSNIYLHGNSTNSATLTVNGTLGNSSAVKVGNFSTLTIGESGLVENTNTSENQGIFISGNTTDNGNIVPNSGGTLIVNGTLNNGASDYLGYIYLNGNSISSGRNGGGTIVVGPSGHFNHAAASYKGFIIYSGTVKGTITNNSAYSPIFVYGGMVDTIDNTVTGSKICVLGGSIKSITGTGNVFFDYYYAGTPTIAKQYTLTVKDASGNNIKGAVVNSLSILDASGNPILPSNKPETLTAYGINDIITGDSIVNGFADGVIYVWAADTTPVKATANITTSDGTTKSYAGNITDYAATLTSQELYSVSLDSQGGSAVDAITDIASGSKITKPTDPTKTNFTFGGWFKEAACTNQWDFSTDTVTSTRTLFAKWTASNDNNNNNNNNNNSNTGGSGGNVVITSPTKTNTIPQQIIAAPAGGTVNIPMSVGNQLTADVLKAATGKDVNTVLDYGKYIWTINGQSISGTIANGGYNLTVTEIEQAPISNLVTTAGTEAIQLEITYSGPLPFTGKLTYPIDAKYNGMTMYLYFYNEKIDALEYRSSYMVENGKFSFDFDHASKYVLTTERLPEIENPFSDVKVGAWYYNAVMTVYRAGLFGGVSGTTFAPQTPMTRASFASVLARLDNADLSGYTESVFNDVNIDEWYGQAATWAAKNGILTGYNNGNFGANDTITREQMALMFYNYIKSKGNQLPQAASDEPFADNSSLSAWAQTAVSDMKKYGLISGVGGNLFNPKGTVTRAEVAQIFLNYVNATK